MQTKWIKVLFPDKARNYRIVILDDLPLTVIVPAKNGNITKRRLI